MTGRSKLAPVITGCGVYGAAAADCAALQDRLRSESMDHIHVHDDPLLLEPWLGARMDAIGNFDELAQRHATAAVLDRARRSTRAASDGVRAGLLAALEAWHQAGLAAVPCDKDESSRRALVLAGQNTANEVLMPAARSFYRGELPQNGRLMQTGHDSYALSVVSEVLELRGEGVVTGAAQASGHLALVQAARLILSGEADVVLVLGAPTRLSALEVAGYQMLGALAPVHTRERADQNYFVLDRRSSGFVPLETAAAVVLESASHAALRGATVLAQMTGWRCAMHASSLPAPDAHAAFLVMQAALKAAQLDPAAPGFVSAHATGTCAGDAAEANAIAKLLGPAVWVNSPKSILGHGMTAAGVLETVAGIVQMRSGFLHACARLAEPLCAGLRHVPAGGVGTAVRSFVNNGFGFGGFNASIVFQSAAAGSAS